MENNLWQNQDGITQGHQVPGLQKYMKAGVRIIVSNQTLLQLVFEKMSLNGYLWFYQPISLFRKQFSY